MSFRRLSVLFSAPKDRDGRRSVPIKTGEKIAAILAEDEKTVFGVDLAIATKRSNKSHYLLPDVAYKCITYLENRGVAEEGIFRLSGSQMQIKDFKDIFNKGSEVDLEKCLNPHTVSGLLKLFLREIPHALFPDMKIIDESEGVATMKIMIGNIAPQNKCLLSCLFRLLHKISVDEPNTKMGVKNLVIVFSATLNCSAANISLLITHAPEIFPENLLLKTKEEKRSAMSIFDEDMFGRPDTPKQQSMQKSESDLFAMEDLDLDGKGGNGGKGGKEEKGGKEDQISPPSSPLLRVSSTSSSPSSSPMLSSSLPVSLSSSSAVKKRLKTIFDSDDEGEEKEHDYLANVTMGNTRQASKIKVNVALFE